MLSQTSKNTKQKTFVGSKRRVRKLEEALKYLEIDLERQILTYEEQGFILIPDTSILLIPFPYKKLRQYYSNLTIKNFLGSETAERALSIIKDILNYEFTVITKDVEEETISFKKRFEKRLKHEYYGPVIHNFFNDWIDIVSYALDSIKKDDNSYSGYIRKLLREEYSRNDKGKDTKNFSIETVVNRLLKKHREYYKNDCFILIDALRILAKQYMDVALITADHHFSYMAETIQEHETRITNELRNTGMSFELEKTPEFQIMIINNPQLYIGENYNKPEPGDYSVIHVLKSMIL